MFLSFNYNTFFLQVLTCIFEHLQVDDIKSCRLVCKRWNTCCLGESNTDKEKLTFRSGLDTTGEINAFLVGTVRTRINVEFVGAILRELDFKTFGRKVKSLLITNCFADDDGATIKNIFAYTPNMTSLVLGLAYRKKNDHGYLRRVFNALRQIGFSNENFRCLTCPDDSIDVITDELSKMFPRLSKLSCCRLNLTRNVEDGPSSSSSSVPLPSLPMLVLFSSSYSCHSFLLPII
jgi:hypothetical protein